MMPTSQSMAQTDVVVIPMIEGDKFIVSEPSTPVPPDNRMPEEFVSFFGTGFVVDEFTGLAWQRTDDGIERNWGDAAEYCGELVLGFQDKWRLPTFDELYTIVDLGRSNPAINQEIFSITQPLPGQGHFWTSSMHISSLGALVFHRTVAFTTALGGTFPDDSEALVRCVM